MRHKALVNRLSKRVRTANKVARMNRRLGIQDERFMAYRRKLGASYARLIESVQ